MEVMSPLLLCALVALLPQGLGEPTISNWMLKNEKNNSALAFQQNPFPLRKLQLNLTGPSFQGVSDMQALFQDILCQNCTSCMERAIRAHEINFKNVIRWSNSELRDRDLNNHVNRRIKRAENSKHPPAMEIKKGNMTTKTKKEKLQKSVTVTKYHVNGKVTVLKLKEMVTTPSVTDDGSSKSTYTTCEVYSIKKSHLCDSPEGDLMVKLAKRKKNRKGKRVVERITEQTVTDLDISVKPSALYKKREIDYSQIPESVISSIEEFY